MNLDGDVPEPVYYKSRPLKNLLLVDEMPSMAPVMDSRVANILDDDAPQIYSLCGTKENSSLRILRNGIEVDELAVSELPGAPLAIWTTKLRRDGEYLGGL